jgi:hypothetical protein
VGVTAMMAESTRLDVRRPALRAEVRALQLFELGLCLRTAIHRAADYDVREAIDYEWHVYTKWEAEVVERFGKEMEIK